MHRSGWKALFLTVFCVTAAVLVSACGSAPAGKTPAAGQGAAFAPTATTGPASPASPSPTALQSPLASQNTTAPQNATATAAPPAAEATGMTAPAAQATATGPSVPATDGSAAVPNDSVTSFPGPSQYTWAQVAVGFEPPLAPAALPGSPDRLLVVEQAGTIRLVQNGAIQQDPFLDIHDRVGSSGNEQGLLGIALHPDFSKNGYFYVNYTDKDGNTVIARFTVSPPDAGRVDPASEKDLLHVQQPFPNHNGGSMVFGPDGYLYMGLGDGGSGGDPYGNGQSTDTLLGKLLRVDVNGGDPYAVPAENPFAKSGGKPEIWSYGLRNPWRFSFDRLTGDLYIADVGQNNWEEVDFLPAGSPGGADFGWNIREGKHPYKGSPPAGANLIDPVFDYSHSFGCSVTGGYVYRGQALPEWRGVYLFADYCSGRVWGLLRGAGDSWQSQVLFQTGMNISSFGQDNNGEVYIIDQASGGVYRLQHS